MGTFVVGFDNQADVALLSRGLWRSDFPEDNLRDYRLTKKARSLDTNVANTQVAFELNEPMHIGMVGLMATNASVDAVYRITLYDDFDLITPIYESGLRLLYPAGTIAFGSIPWGAPNWWTAQPLPAEIARFQNNVVHVLANATWGQYGLIEIFDPDNSNGYFEAGRLFVGSVFRPERNPQAGKASLRLNSRSTVTRAKDGTPYLQAERADISLPFALDFLTQDEAMKVIDLQAIADIYGEVMAMVDAGDVLYAFRRQVFGRLTQLDPIEHTFLAMYNTAFQVEGTL